MHSTARSQRGNTLVGLVIGLLIGVLIAAAVAIYINFGPKPFTEEKNRAPARPAAQRSTPPTPLPGQPAEKPKLDFYRILPGGESASAPTITSPPKEPVASQQIYLQVGSFQNPADADNLKARLAMSGIEANVQRVDLGTKGIYHRVRLGPYASADAAEGLRARLATEGLEATKVKATP
ncbi:MAG: cell division protein FtsN [Candidatus Dactylopiibacterium carminicum]|uniref:Cell division protein FtsN n=1 Tax=Candidatus Dactylopiibacterium carminicum TaxID=857335 RepID=A0A272EQL0_9RHOO|nr:SPOR domain-containing protein [Candidatus Dactylopiibacterium carminicum]KAF7598633.1 cell division protein FtsN [Candidatus Dactylopiibacterium carminicum]PAS92399.1 MAG: cell division protein FtsN [Candidatus Dactylopiibacterium carminicum]PAS96008.1 MAG: cell division protein FtsN [Candidatus Dactylopiibacterium carminicum]PAS98400.1 MAG: hypothetical protein BSR46_12200 [Candidatus Dactylopiibacterium carminicum]